MKKNQLHVSAQKFHLARCLLPPTVQFQLPAKSQVLLRSASCSNVRRSHAWLELFPLTQQMMPNVTSQRANFQKFQHFGIQKNQTN